MLAHRLRRWHNIKIELAQRLVSVVVPFADTPQHRVADLGNSFYLSLFSRRWRRLRAVWHPAGGGSRLPTLGERHLRAGALLDGVLRKAQVSPEVALPDPLPVLPDWPGLRVVRGSVGDIHLGLQYHGEHYASGQHGTPLQAHLGRLETVLRPRMEALSTGNLRLCR